MHWKHRNLLDLDDLTAAEIEHVLQTAIPMKEILERPIKNCRPSGESRLR